MIYVKCTKKLPGQLSPDRKQEQEPTVEPIHVHGGKSDLVANINLIRAHGSTLTPRQGSTKEWKTQMKEDFVPREGEAPNKQLQQDRTNFMRTSAYLPLEERSAVAFAQPDTDVHSRRTFQKYDAACYVPDRKDRVAAHPSRSNVVLDADRNVSEDKRLRATSTMHDQFQKPNIEAVGKLKTRDQRGENQQELMRSNWSYGAPDDSNIDHGESGNEASSSSTSTGRAGRGRAGRGGAGGARSLAGAVSVAKQPLPTRDDPKLKARLPAERAPEEVQLPSITFLEGQSGKHAKYFSRVPFQSGCNLSSSTMNPALMSMPGAGTTTNASYPKYHTEPGNHTKTAASKVGGAENMGHAVTLANGKKQYVPSSVQIGDYEPTSYVTSQKSQFRGVWFDDDKNNKKK